MSRRAFTPQPVRIEGQTEVIVGGVAQAEFEEGHVMLWGEEHLRECTIHFLTKRLQQPEDTHNKQV